jgi:hypothetical protein
MIKSTLTSVFAPCLLFILFHLCSSQEANDNYVFINDEVYLESYIKEFPTIVDRTTATETKVVVKSTRERFFDIFRTYETYKDKDFLWKLSPQGRQTLSKMRYVICPVWFADENNVPANVTKINDIMERTKVYYERMSWYKNVITWEFLPDLKLVNISASQNATRGQVSTACTEYMTSIGYIYPITHTGLIVAYNPTIGGDFSFKGGVATINGNTVWNSLNFDIAVNRHELGHNYGHPHHFAYSYDWRFKRGTESPLPDGFDMMSDGM